ncbi:hypothetical protein [Nocardioides pantholopis]|uniref:hypothetical protein n=1 Tax=Nocardioides pantholopis TaxID=2483798 RepID=UPI000FDA2E9E|nr:hypothetical protein [Nocardioides pantholopis]
MSSGWAPRPLAATGALVLGLLAGAGSGGAVATSQDTRAVAEFPPGDRVRDAVAEIRDDGVHVAPDGRSMLDEAGEARVEAAVAAADRVPVRVIVWSESRHVGDDAMTVDAQLEAALGEERSLILVWQGPQTGRVLTTGGYAYSGVYSNDFLGDPAATLPELIETAQQTEWREDEPSGSGGPIAAGVALGGMIGLTASGAALIVTWRWRRRRSG